MKDKAIVDNTIDNATDYMKNRSLEASELHNKMNREELLSKKYYDKKQDLWVISLNAVQAYINQPQIKEEVDCDGCELYDVMNYDETNPEDCSKLGTIKCPQYLLTLSELRDGIINELKSVYPNYRFAIDSYNNICMKEQPINLQELLLDEVERKTYKLAHKITTYLMMLEEGK